MNDLLAVEQVQLGVPLAARMRPQVLTQCCGQLHLIAPGKPLFQAYEKKQLHSMIFWGPPGCGKTTLAKLLAENIEAHVEQISAVLAGVKEIRQIMEIAQQLKVQENRSTVLFVDEIHRFNKAQQDAFLPFVEEGRVILIGATTENPSFALNNALLSRLRVYVLKTLDSSALMALMDKALSDTVRGLGKLNLSIDHELKQQIIEFADGDARQLLNTLEILADFAENKAGKNVVDQNILNQILTVGNRRFDRKDEYFYDQISALHKAVRGSAPDAALYWLARMLDGGADPLYIARRVLRMASEDIGLADPNALTVALKAWQTYEHLGSPEGELALAEAVVYMALAPKSNAVYTAFLQAKQDVKQFGSLEVPLHIRNAPTKLMKNLGYGENYRYAHDEENAYAAGENYFPEKLKNRQYYFPVERGFEIKLKEKLKMLQQLDQKAEKTK